MYYSVQDNFQETLTISGRNCDSPREAAIALWKRWNDPENEFIDECDKGLNGELLTDLQLFTLLEKYNYCVVSHEEIIEEAYFEVIV